MEEINLFFCEYLNVEHSSILLKSMNIIFTMFRKTNTVKKKMTNLTQFKNSKLTENIIYNFVARILLNTSSTCCIKSIFLPDIEMLINKKLK